MASLNLVDCQSRFAIIGTDGEGVPISFPLGSDGLAVITTIWLNLQFQLNIASLHIDKEVFDSVIGNLFPAIGQLPMYNGRQALVTKDWEV